MSENFRGAFFRRSLLREAMDRRGLTKKDLGKLTKPSRITAQFHYRGLYPIGVHTALQYEEAFGIPRWELRPDFWSKEDWEYFPDRFEKLSSLKQDNAKLTKEGE